MYCLSHLVLIGAATAVLLESLTSRSGAIHKGEMTFDIDFSSNACNVPATGMDVAINAATFDLHSSVVNGIENPNRNALCGKVLSITHPTTGATAIATIVGRKASGGAEAVDVSQAVFAALGVDTALGHCQVNWVEPGYT